MTSSKHEDDQNAELAAFFQVSPQLLPYVDDLLVDLQDLGGSPALITSLLKDAGVAREDRALDLGCGKGAVSIALARAFGWKVEGIDAYEPFIQEARKQAAGAGVADLCNFRVGDIRKAVKEAGSFDAVLYVSVGSVLGAQDECMAALRQCVRPGGLIVLDDGYRVDEDLDFPGYRHMASREKTLRLLTSQGDSIEQEHPIPLEDIRDQNQRYTECIEARARMLSSKHPELAGELTAYVNMQREECRILEEKVQCVTWILRRSD